MAGCISTAGRFLSWLRGGCPAPNSLLVLIFHFLCARAVSSCKDLHLNSGVFIFGSSASILVRSCCFILSLPLSAPLLFSHHSCIIQDSPGPTGRHTVGWGFVRGDHHGNRLSGFRGWRVRPRTVLWRCRPRRAGDSVSAGV